MNWNTLKAFSREELLSMVPEGFEFKTDPWTHQIAAFLANISNEGFLDALDLGTGKTKVAIDTCRFIDFNNGGENNIKVLYLCLHSAVEKMRDEVITHSDFTATCVKGNKKEKWKLFNEKTNFHIINYEGLRSLLTERKVHSKIQVLDEKTGRLIDKVKRKDNISVKLMRRFLKKNYNVLIIDESHTIKSTTSLIYMIISRMCRSFEYRILLTGTPFGNTLIDIWSQYFVVDFGETYFPRFTMFRNSYFENKGWFGPLWVPTEKGAKEINKKLYSKAIRYKEDECQDLPQKVFRVLDFSLDKKQRDLYNKLVKDDYDSLLVNIKKKSITLREIVSGFIESEKYVFKKNPKLDLLMDLILNSYEDHKIVVFVERTMSRRIIERAIKKKKIPYTSLSGETKDKYKENMKFQKDPKFRVMVANIKTGGASIDLTAATYCVHYELGGSVINHKQSLKRVHRGGQTKRCFFYTLVGKGTVEVSIYKDLKNNDDAFNRIVDGEHARAYLMGEVDGES